MNLSPHPVDRLIRELIRTGRAATEDEVAQIVDRIATAPFNPHQATVDEIDRGRPFLGRTLRAVEESLFYHLYKRVVVQQQWSPSTTAEEYVADLRQAIRQPVSRLVIYARDQDGWREHIAGVMAENPVPMRRRGARALPWIYVVYSADRGIILSGYQVRSLQSVSIPEDAQWLT